SSSTPPSAGCVATLRVEITKTRRALRSASSCSRRSARQPAPQWILGGLAYEKLPESPECTSWRILTDRPVAGVLCWSDQRSTASGTKESGNDYGSRLGARQCRRVCGQKVSAEP